MRRSVLEFSVRGVLIAEDQLVKEAIHIGIEQASALGSGTNIFRIRGLDGSSCQLFDLS